MFFVVKLNEFAERTVELLAIWNAMFGDNHLSEPMMVYWRLNPKDQISMENAYENAVC